MSNVNEISKRADYYYFSAKTAQDAQLKTYFDTVIKQIASYAHSGLVSTKHLISKPGYTNSTGLKEFLQVLPEIQKICSEAKIEWADQTLSRLGSYIGRAAFFASSGNAGTGYDSLTAAKVDQYTPPNWYINQIDSLHRSLKDHMQQNKGKTKPLANT
jgi:hypothetical protein